MKVNLENRSWGTEMELIPENLKEVTHLFRMVRNSRKETPTMFLSFNNDDPKCYVTFYSLRGNAKKTNSLSL